jgi:hypothetical protein
MRAEKIRIAPCEFEHAIDISFDRIHVEEE